MVTVFWKLRALSALRSAISGAMTAAYGAPATALINAVVGIALVAVLALLIPPSLRRARHAEPVADSGVTATP